MAHTKERLSRLMTTLVQSKIKANDNPLFQTIDGLIKIVSELGSDIHAVEDLAALKTPSVKTDLAIANPTGTASTTLVMMGLAAYITPLYFTRVMFIMSGNLTNSSATAGDGTACRIRYGTGTAPANGDALIGTAGSRICRSILERNAADLQPFCCQGLITGLTPGTQYWFDLSLGAITGGTGLAQDIAITGFEL